MSVPGTQKLGFLICLTQCHRLFPSVEKMANSCKTFDHLNCEEGTQQGNKPTGPVVEQLTRSHTEVWMPGGLTPQICGMLGDFV